MKVTETRHEYSTIDLFPPNRSRGNRRLHKIGQESPTAESSTDEIDSELQREPQEPLVVQSLSSITSHLIDSPEESLENSAEKDVFLQNFSLEHHTGGSTGGSFAGEIEEGPTGSPSGVDTSDNGDDENQSELKTVGTLTLVRPKPRPTSWIVEDSHRTTTPKGLTTWSAVNGVQSHNLYPHHNHVFKGNVQRVPAPPEYPASSATAGYYRPAIYQSVVAATRRTTTSPTTTLKTRPLEEQTTTRKPTTTTSTTTVAPKPSSTTLPPRRKLPYTRFKPKPQNSKYIRQPLENVIAKPIASDDTHTTFQLVIPEKNAQYNRPTKRPHRWPMNPTTTKASAFKKTAFMKITKKPYINPHFQPSRFPFVTFTTPATTTAVSSSTTPTPQSSTTTYYRNPTPLIQALPISLTDLPFLDFLRSQVLSRIGLSVLSLIATSPLLLTLLGSTSTAGIVGRRKRDLNGLPDFDPSLLIKRLDKTPRNSRLNDTSQGKQQYSAHPAGILSTKLTTLLTQLVRRLFRLNFKDSKINTKKDND